MAATPAARAGKLARRRRPPATWPVRLARRLPPVLLTEPWAIFIKSVCIVSGGTALLGPEPASIGATLPGPARILWAVTLVLGASAGLWGLLRPSGRRVEVAGLIWLGTAAVVYGAAILSRLQLDSLVAGGIVLGFGLAALTRALAVHVTYVIAAAHADGPPASRPRQRWR